MHGHGGIVLVMLGAAALHNDIGCSYDPNSWGERYHWYSSTGWVMWNAQLAGLLSGTTCCIYDGNPGGSKEQAGLDRAVALRRGAGRHLLRRRRGLLRQLHEGGRGPVAVSRTEAGARAGHHRLAAVGGRAALGHPRSSRKLGVPDIWWCNISGGTDFAGAFIGGNRELPQVPGQMQCRELGCAVEAWNEQGSR